MCKFSCFIHTNVIITASLTLYIERVTISPNQHESSFKMCTLVTDNIKYNEQNKLIGKEPLYLLAEFDAL